MDGFSGAVTPNLTEWLERAEVSGGNHTVIVEISKTNTLQGCPSRIYREIQELEISIISKQRAESRLLAAVIQSFRSVDERERNRLFGQILSEIENGGIKPKTLAAAQECRRWRTMSAHSETPSVEE